ncbi:MAG TPA: HD domain-containing phosphohydrolase [Steroidobacteraceae bacterium]|jgi:response regulator RpfG family c-di-GMP phosphodiesterase|nr:HD domain-containing phosphohydrolase [Steroidobacteraceae bacterium]
MAGNAKPRVLFVDDEQRLLEGIATLLRREYEVHVATSGPEALQKLDELKDVAVVVSDFRMPRMDGATFLHEAIQRAPLATRILLTGEAGVEGAKEAVNKGQIFRFLTKPCPTDQLRIALDAGIAQYRLLNAERAVMQETLIECISALMEVLAVTNPTAFGRAQRIKGLVKSIAARLECGEFWQLEAAALLSQIGYFAETPELAEKIYYGRQLSAEERARAARVSGNARRLLEHIPRLEPVIQILAAIEWTDAQLAQAGERMVGLGARILSAALEYDAHITKGVARSEIVAELRRRELRFGAKVIEAIAELAGTGAATETVTDIVFRDAKPGMRLRQEIRTPLGALLVPIGFEISERLLERISQVAPDVLDQQVRVALPRNNA